MEVFHLEGTHIQSETVLCKEKQSSDLLKVQSETMLGLQKPNYVIFQTSVSSARPCALWRAQAHGAALVNIKAKDTSGCSGSLHGPAIVLY